MAPGRLLHSGLVMFAAAAAGCDRATGPPRSDPVPALARLGGEFRYPVFLTAPPADSTRVFLVLQEGLILVFVNGVQQTQPFLDLTATVTCCGERGLLGMAFHPQYAGNGSFFVNYTGAGGTTQVVRYQVSADPNVANAGSAVPVITQSQPFANHNGGMLAFGPDGYLYIGLGDGGSGGDPLGNAQNMSTWLGKMLRLDVDGAPPYTVPAGNPFVGQTGILPEIWASGLRNPWRYSFDRLTGELYIADVGQREREEVNVQPATAGGLNYGWNTMEGSICYNAATCPTGGLTVPAIDYPRSNGCAVTGGYVYRGAALPVLTGRYLYADLCQGWVRSFTTVAGAATDPLQWDALGPGGLVVSFGEDAAGELYVLSFDQATEGTRGAVHRVVPAP